MSQNKAVVAASIIAIAASLLLFSSKPKESKETLVAKWTKKLQNHPVSAAMIVAVTVVMSLGALLAAIKGIVEFYYWIAL